MIASTLHDCKKAKINLLSYIDTSTIISLLSHKNVFTNKQVPKGLEPWSSSYWRRLMFRRLWVRIPTTNIGWS